MDVDVYMGRKIEMNDICLGCGDEELHLIRGTICEVCWRGD